MLISQIILAIAMIHSTPWNSECSYANAFQKGRDDVAGGSYGANLDRYCATSSGAQREEFQKAYEFGRTNAKDFEALQISEIPKSQAEAEKILKDAQQEKEKQDAADALKKQALELKRQRERIYELELENQNLDHKVNRLNKDTDDLKKTPWKNK